MTDKKSKIIYTYTDEAPALATHSFLPIIEKFAASAEVEIELSDISLAARILSAFPDNLTDEQRVPDALAELGALTSDSETNIIKLPNVSASIPQLVHAITELQEHGYNIPDYPAEPSTKAETLINKIYSSALGSSVNPVLREGNSDRRAPASVKQFARNHPHSMGKWSQSSRTHVAHMRHGDFYHSDKSTVIEKTGMVSIQHTAKDGTVTVLRDDVPVTESEIIDGTFMSVKALRTFLEEEMEGAKNADLLFSLHLKSTMMKISDPIIFGHAVTVYFKDAFDKHAETFEKLGVDPSNGLASAYEKIKDCGFSLRNEIEADLRACYENRPETAMVDSDRGITNLHVPSDVIVDASMPAMIRLGGKMWGTDGKLKDTKAIIPDSCYATMYQEVINFCKHHDAFDPTTMGSVQNVGLMAQKAEEYGSHDKTFTLAADGDMRIVDADGQVLIEHLGLDAGDIWRMCQTKDAPIQDWVKLAVNRSRASGIPVVFWLDPHRGHDAQMIKKVKKYLKDHDTEELDIRIMSVDLATRHTLERLRHSEDTISATGNVLRDYLTDLFPILELGTSAKMLSVVPLMAGGGLFETGAGGSAPKHVQQFVEENHLRWDSLGEFLALAVSLEDVAEKTSNARAKILATTLDIATGKLLDLNKSPSRKTGEIDNRGSHYFLARYWAEAIGNQDEDTQMRDDFKQLAADLESNEDAILSELIDIQGGKVDLKGYYQPDPKLADEAMRPSATLNKLIDG
ncbi:MAG: NADP-dependent isocitrate dehydrogenase [Pseudomonadales bacterium]